MCSVWHTQITQEVSVQDKIRETKVKSLSIEAFKLQSGDEEVSLI